jgi:hypothetical protein
MARPGCARGLWRVGGQSAAMYPASFRKLCFPGPRWKSARPDPHKSCVFCKTLNLPGFRDAGRLPSHLSLFPSADVVSCVARRVRRCPFVAQAAAAFSASNERPLASRAQAILASLLASATTATL